ncbi:MAG TPA: flagellar basal body L-ring protein FlgH [Phycisphaerales bacterium]|nr:flagellar basal body L-ring protein FlgH [Phycisphaerales bacterium]
MSRRIVCLAFTIVLACAPAARAQSLLRQPPAAPAQIPAAPAPGAPPAASAPPPSAAPSATGPDVRQASLIAVTPPEPRRWQAHDLVQIIINQQSVQKYEQSLDTQKKYDLRAELAKFPSLRHLLEAQLRGGDSTPIVEVDAGGGTKFNGEGTFERTDRFTTRVGATVLEVKPNGTLLLEARMVSDSGGETTTLVVAGLCRPEDITLQNTIQSNQMSDLVIRAENTGEVKNAAKKGFIPKVLDAIFNI